MHMAVGAWVGALSRLQAQHSAFFGLVADVHENARECCHCAVAMTKSSTDMTGRNRGAKSRIEHPLQHATAPDAASLTRRALLLCSHNWNICYCVPLRVARGVIHQLHAHRVQLVRCGATYKHSMRGQNLVATGRTQLDSITRRCCPKRTSAQPCRRSLGIPTSLSETHRLTTTINWRRCTHVCPRCTKKGRCQ